MVTNTAIYDDANVAVHHYRGVYRGGGASCFLGLQPLFSLYVQCSFWLHSFSFLSVQSDTHACDRKSHVHRTCLLHFFSASAARPQRPLSSGAFVVDVVRRASSGVGGARQNSSSVSYTHLRAHET